MSCFAAVKCPGSALDRSDGVSKRIGTVKRRQCCGSQTDRMKAAEAAVWDGTELLGCWPTSAHETAEQQTPESVD